ncbi:MAG: hypothetical protein DMF09_12265 [Verrucomicrobia bacterium]|nr:MAG: hypothetical protein DMF09_12265 [Verrucomicrobiota bacterium]
MRSFILPRDQPVSNTNRHECIRIGERTRLGCGRKRLAFAEFPVRKFVIARTRSPAPETGALPRFSAAGISLTKRMKFSKFASIRVIRGLPNCICVYSPGMPERAKADVH